MDSNIIFVALYSYLDKNKYTESEIIAEIKKCYKKGASIVHFHVNKVVNGVEGFLNILKKIEEYDIVVAISLSDYELIKDKEIKNKCTVSLHASSCYVFNNKIIQEYEDVENKIKEYLKNGFIPELSIFNKEGIENAIKLNNKYAGKFIASVYLGYPNELEVSIETIRDVCSKLKKCNLVSIAIYNNNNLDYTEEIIKNNAIIRVGLEDSMYNGNKLAKNNVEILDTVNNLTKKLNRKIIKIGE
ncbi:MAG: 3-keto-5-aminohexanoate cleavage protein [Clostridia bacterium]|nr:3-keto-5-aminohexanoate cleavage protein [Clostridia bacterium]